MGIMGVSEADCGGCRDWSSGIGNLQVLLALSKELLDVSESWLGICPSTGILWFLLGPSDASVLVFLQLSDDLLEWEWAVRLYS